MYRGIRNPCQELLDIKKIGGLETSEEFRGIRNQIMGIRNQISGD